MTRTTIPLAALLFALGCGSGRPAGDVERGRRAVAALAVVSRDPYY